MHKKIYIKEIIYQAPQLLQRT